MCRAMEEMRDKAAAEATMKTTLELVENLMQSMQMTAEQAMKTLMIPEEKQNQYLKML